MAWIIGKKKSETLVGTDFADLIFGNGGSDTISGLEGRDRLSGGDDNDTLFGDEGRDLLRGDLGQDDLFGSFFGSADSDVFIFTSGDTGVDRVWDFQDGLDLLDVRDWDVAFRHLRFTETATGNLIVQGDDRGETFVIIGTTAAQIDRDDFIF